MSQATGNPGFWFRHGDPGPARERLYKVVAALTRARRLQLLVDHGFGGLLAGLVLATVAVLVARLMPSPYPAWQLAGAAVIIAVVIALLVGWRRRPDSLDVAIRADVMLRLKQRLSTAWEFVTLHGHNPLADRLAVQAVRAAVPADPWRVFPLRVNRWGWLAPLAATALLLASVVDLDRMQMQMPQALDERVVGEGRRLAEVGRAMRARAERDKLPRSTRQAAQLERLGARMEGGALSRSQALGQLSRMEQSLDEERVQARAEANLTGSGARRAARAEGSHVAPGLNPGAMLERMQRGALDSDDTRALAQRRDDLERLGIPRRELENALERHRSGADDALREMLETLAQLDRALKEDKELSNAREQVRRAQDSLGDARAGTGAERAQMADMEWDEDEDRGVKGATEAGVDGRLEGATTGRAARAGSQGDKSVATGREHSPLAPDPGPAGRVLAPQGQVHEGESFTSHGQVLPRTGRPNVESIEMKAEFATQMEEVLSKDQYPAHYKEFVRRYFLNLSQGAPVPPAQPPGTRGAP
jgi:hypothetical protein